MAEILIKAVDATNSDPVKDARGCYKRGDPVVIFENGHEWGLLEALPPKDGGKFVRIRISDVTAAQVKAFLQTRWGVDLLAPDTNGVDAQGSPIVVRRKLLRVATDSLPAGVRNILNNTGFYETTWAAIRTYVRNKRTGETA